MNTIYEPEREPDGFDDVLARLARDTRATIADLEAREETEYRLLRARLGRTPDGDPLRRLRERFREARHAAMRPCWDAHERYAQARQARDRKAGRPAPTFPERCAKLGVEVVTIR